jgi:hypothetical protein
VTASSVLPAPIPKLGAVITGLSNGVDSLSVCKDYLLSDDAAANMRITHFLFNNVGSHGRKVNPKSAVMHKSRTAGAQHSARALGVPLIGLESNLDLFYSTPFINTHTLRNAAAALTLQAGARYFLYASTYPYRKISVGHHTDLSKIDPILVPLLSTEGLEMFSAGAAYTRTDKTRLISEMEVAHHHLDVCVVSSPNCSTCWKCSRTLLTLELLGRIDQFSAVFNVPKFKKLRKAI